MAYKQTPGRSPFLKTGREIPLNMTSPLHQSKTVGGWFKNLGAEVKAQGGVGGGGVASVLGTSVKNIARGAKYLWQGTAKNWDADIYRKGSGNKSLFTSKNWRSKNLDRALEWENKRSGKDVFMK